MMSDPSSNELESKIDDLEQVFKRAVETISNFEPLEPFNLSIRELKAKLMSALRKEISQG